MLVDTPYTSDAMETVQDWVGEQFGARQITAINTGFHYDNLGGNGYLRAKGIPIYGADLMAQLLEERGEAMRVMTLDWLQAPRYQTYYEAHKTLVYVPPTHLFEIDVRMTLEYRDESVEVYFPGPSHSPDNVVVYLPAQKLLFGGCMIVGRDALGNTSDANLAAWPAAVRDLARFEVTLVVPGHGERLDPGLIEHTLTLLEEE